MYLGLLEICLPQSWSLIFYVNIKTFKSDISFGFYASSRGKMDFVSYYKKHHFANEKVLPLLLNGFQIVLLNELFLLLSL